MISAFDREGGTVVFAICVLVFALSPPSSDQRSRSHRLVVALSLYLSPPSPLLVPYAYVRVQA